VGLDYSAGVYRVVSEQGSAYLLKVTSGPLYEPRYQVPRYLNDQGITSVIAPLPTRSGGLWAKLVDWTAIVYPFIDGDSSFTGMTHEHWRELGSIFKQIHQVIVPAERFESLRKETFDAAEYVRWIHTFEIQHLHSRHGRSVSQHTFRADWLTHQANLIRDYAGHVCVIDWDEVMLAPKERDFIFVRESGADAFWEGYGQPQVDWIALTYYRWERVVQDMIACADDMFFKDDLGVETRADIAGLFHEILLGNTSTINDVYAAAAHLPADLT
jgi:spectinomycin phosphotransferase